MPDDTPHQQPQQLAVAMPGLPLVYANAMQAAGGAFDVTIAFGYGSGEGSFEPAVRVAMSWEHAALMAEQLQRMIKQYEADIGPVRHIPDRVTAEAGS